MGTHGARRGVCAGAVAALLPALLLVVPGASPVAAADPGCTISATLVNSCRPWVGAESGGYGPGGFKARMLEHEARIGRQLDIVHAYMAAGAVKLSDDQVALAKRPGTIGLYNWRVSLDWTKGGGSDAGVNSQIDQMATSIKSLGSTKIMLAVYHEPEMGLSPGGSPSCPTVKLTGTAGTATDYVNMWHNVRERFDALGVTNVVWVMDYMGYTTSYCLARDLWPGNDYVDWVMWDPYPYPSLGTWTSVVGGFYNHLTANSDASHDFLSKPWGLAEYGYLGADQSKSYGMYDDAAKAVHDNVFPKLKAYVVWDNYTSTSHDDRVGYSQTHVLDPLEQQHYNALVNDPAFVGTAVPEPTDQVAPTVVRTSPADGTTVKGTVEVTGHASDDVGLDRVQLLVDRNPVGSARPGDDGDVSLSWNSADVANGQHTLRLWARDTSGNTAVSDAVTVNVRNVDDEAPTVPQGLSSSWSSGTGVRLDWSASSDDLAVTGYRIYRDGEPFTTLESTDTSYVDEDVDNLATHSYAVSALDAAGNESDPSAPTEVTTGDDTAPSVTTVDAQLTAPDEATLTWSPATDNDAVAGYRVFRDGTKVADVTGGTTTWVDDGLDDATTYSYEVAAYDAAGNVGVRSDPDQVTTPDRTAPAAPADLSAVTGTSSVALSWDAATDNVGVASYVVYRDGLPFATVLGTVTTWTDTAPVGNTAHRYQVLARDAALNEGPRSNEVARTVDSTPPTVPTALTAVSSPASVALAWGGSTDAGGVAGYVVYRDGLPLVTLASTARSYTDSSLVGATLHRYEVTARDVSGNESAKSNQVARMVDTTLPTVPTSLTAVSSPTSVALTWGGSTDAGGVAGYVVYRDGLPLVTLASTARSYTDSALVGSTLHRYQVTARDTSGNESARSNQVTRVLADTTAPTTPTKLAGALSGLTVRLTWTASTDAVGVTGYTIYRGGVAIGTSTTPTYTDLTPPLGKASSYTVRARDAAGNTSAASSAVSVTVPTDKTAPTTPGSLRATVGATGTRQITLAWNASTDNVGVVSYYLYRANAKYKLLGKVTSYVDTGLKAGTKYTYKVYALDAAGNWSGASASVSGTAR